MYQYLDIQTQRERESTSVVSDGVFPAVLTDPTDYMCLQTQPTHPHIIVLCSRPLAFSNSSLLWPGTHPVALSLKRSSLKSRGHIGEMGRVIEEEFYPALSICGNNSTHPTWQDRGGESLPCCYSFSQNCVTTSHIHWVTPGKISLNMQIDEHSISSRAQNYQMSLF